MRYIISILYIILGALVLYQSLGAATYTSSGILMSVAFGVVSLIVGFLLLSRARNGEPVSRALKISAWGIALIFIATIVMVLMVANRIS